MRQKLLRLLLLCLLTGMSASAVAMPYAYVSQYEVTPLGEGGWWSTADSIYGDVFTNDTSFCWINAPFVDGTVYVGGRNTHCGAIGAVVESSTRVVLPTVAQQVRTAAAAQGLYFGSYYSRTQYVAHLRGQNMRLYWADEGVPFDSVAWYQTTVQGGYATRLFFDGNLRISGVFNGDWGIGCSKDIWIDDNVVAQGTNLENGELPEDCDDYLALFSERSIIIRNTWANGRENSAQGSDVVITAVLASYGDESGSLELDQPNNIWDTYICPCSPDLRGTIRITGALLQRFHTPWRNNNNGGTGYNFVLRYDERLRCRGILFDPWLYTDLPDSIDFGEVAVGEAARDTITITSNSPFYYSGALTSHPFSAPTSFQYTCSLSIPVAFAPTRAGLYSGFISFYLNNEYQEVFLHGTAITPPATQSFTASAYPNPFNAVTTLSLVLPQSGELKITLFDLLGREVEQLSYSNLPSGQQTMRLDMSSFASGVYFTRLQSGEHTATQKLLLMK